MARKRNDSTGSVDRGVKPGAKPVEQYRKQIGKQDTKKSRESMKEAKFRAEKKENAPAQYKDVAIMVTALLAVAVCVYIVFYVVLTETTNPNVPVPHAPHDE